jgi:hypothetical protein
VSGTLETVEEVEVWEVAETVDEDGLPETDEPRELRFSLEVENRELDAVDPTLSAEYAAIPAASSTTTIAAIQVGRMGCRYYGRSLLNP